MTDAEVARRYLELIKTGKSRDEVAKMVGHFVVDPSESDWLHEEAEAMGAKELTEPEEEQDE